MICSARRTRRGAIFSPYSPSAPVILPDIRLDNVLCRHAEQPPDNAEREEDVAIEILLPRLRRTAIFMDTPPPPLTQAPAPPPYAFDPSIPPQEHKRLKKSIQQKCLRRAADVAAVSHRRCIKAVSLKHLTHAVLISMRYVAPVREYVSPRTAENHMDYLLDGLIADGFRYLPWPGW